MNAECITKAGVLSLAQPARSRQTVKEAERVGLRASASPELVSAEEVRNRIVLTYRVPVALAGDNEATRKAAGFNESAKPVDEAEGE